MKNKIKEIREQKNLTQKEFAALLGVTENTISRYENGKVLPPKTIKLLMTFTAEALRFAEKKAVKKGLL